MQHFSPFERFQNFPLYVTEFDEHCLEYVVLSAAGVIWIQTILLQYYKKRLLPFLHTTGYRHSVFVDAENMFGRGPNALVSWGGPDRTLCHVISDSIVDFLSDHLAKLQNQFYFNQKGQIESFPADPLQFGGSVTVTNGVRIEAVGRYIHYFSLFDTTYYHKPKFFFAYQIRLSVAQEALELEDREDSKMQEPFYKCELRVRAISF